MKDQIEKLKEVVGETVEVEVKFGGIRLIMNGVLVITPKGRFSISAGPHKTLSFTEDDVDSVQLGTDDIPSLIELRTESDSVIKRDRKNLEHRVLVDMHRQIR